MKIREITENKKQYISLLLLADEQESMIDLYLDRGTMYILSLIHIYIGYYDEKKSSFANWAAGIARYKAVDYLRKYYKNASYENIDDLDIPQNDKGLEEIVEREISDELEQMLGCLGEQDKEIFLKLYMEEKDMEQVSQETGLSKNVIYNRISRGRRKIQKEYPGEKEA